MRNAPVGIVLVTTPSRRTGPSSFFNSGQRANAATTVVIGAGGSVTGPVGEGVLMGGVAAKLATASIHAPIQKRKVRRGIIRNQNCAMVARSPADVHPPYG